MESQEVTQQVIHTNVSAVSLTTILIQLINLLLMAGVVYLLVLLTRALRKYLRPGRKLPLSAALWEKC